MIRKRQIKLSQLVQKDIAILKSFLEKYMKLCQQNTDIHKEK